MNICTILWMSYWIHGATIVFFIYILRDVWPVALCVVHTVLSDSTSSRSILWVRRHLLSLPDRSVAQRISIKSLTMFIKQFNYDCNIFLFFITRYTYWYSHKKESVSIKLLWEQEKNVQKYLVFFRAHNALLTERESSQRMPPHRIHSCKKTLDWKRQKTIGIETEKEHTHIDCVSDDHHKRHTELQQQKWEERSRKKIIVNCMQPAQCEQIKS